MMRRVGAIVTVLWLLCGCGAFRDGDGRAAGSGAEQAADHEIRYQARFSGVAPGSQFQVSYTADDGQSVDDTSVGGAPWSKSITVHSPDVPEVLLVVNSSQEPDATSPLGGQPPKLQCVIWVDGRIADQKESTVPQCRAKLAAGG